MEGTKTGENQNQLSHILDESQRKKWKASIKKKNKNKQISN